MTKTLKFLGFILGLFFSAKAHGYTLRSADAGVNITTKKVAHVIGTVDTVNATKFVFEMTRTAKLPGDRVIVIDSHGGEQMAGDTIIDRIELEKRAGVRVMCVVMGWSESMAFNILTHCDVRVAEKRAVLLFHEIAAGEWRRDKRLTPFNMRQEADMLEQDDKPYRKANAAALHMAFDDYDLFARNNHQWLAPDMVLMGYLHGLTDK